MNRVHITTTIGVNEKNFCDENGIVIAQLLDNAIRERMEQDGNLIRPTLKEEIRRREAFQKLSSDLREYIEKKGLLEDWLNGQKSS